MLLLDGIRVGVVITVGENIGSGVGVNWYGFYNDDDKQNQVQVHRQGISFT
jgi:hypothetical protein